MTKFLQEKKKLLQQVYQKASNNTTETSFTGILKSLELELLEDYKILLSYKSLENYYKSIVEKNEDYKIKKSTLDDLSKFLGYDDFYSFCEIKPDSNLTLDKNNLTIQVDDNDSFSTKILDQGSNINIQITNKPTFVLPDFITKPNKLSVLGIIVISGFLIGNTQLKDNYLSDFNWLNDNSENSTVIEPKQLVDEKNNEEIKPIIQNEEKKQVQYLVQLIDQDQSQKITTKDENQCMYWNGEKYLTIDCREEIVGVVLEAKKAEKFLMQRITRPDTLTFENAENRVWYDKSNNQVEFFTQYGLHPTNHKTLRAVTKHMIEKYAK